MILPFKARVVADIETPLDGLAWHLASMLDEDFGALSPIDQQWYRTMAEMVVSACKGRKERSHGEV